MSRTLSGTGVSQYQPGTGGFTYTGGTLRGTLSGPSGTDFDLYLQRNSSGFWTTVASSLGTSSSETINYAASAGTYRWRVYSYRGSGAYTLNTQK